jgi:hypothetical protein
MIQVRVRPCHRTFRRQPIRVRLHHLAGISSLLPIPVQTHLLVTRQHLPQLLKIRFPRQSQVSQSQNSQPAQALHKACSPLVYAALKNSRQSKREF